MERFNPLNDYLFLKLMGEKGDEEQCLAFLNAVLGSKSLKPVILVKILENKTFVADIVGDKSSILDVRVETDIGEKIKTENVAKIFITILHYRYLLPAFFR